MLLFTIVWNFPTVRERYQRDSLITEKVGSGKSGVINYEEGVWCVSVGLMN